MVWDLEGKRRDALKTFTDDDLASELERRQRQRKIQEEREKINETISTN